MKQYKYVSETIYKNDADKSTGDIQVNNFIKSHTENGGEIFKINFTHINSNVMDIDVLFWKDK